MDLQHKFSILPADVSICNWEIQIVIGNWIFESFVTAVNICIIKRLQFICLRFQKFVIPSIYLELVFQYEIVQRFYPPSLEVPLIQKVFVGSKNWHADLKEMIPRYLIVCVKGYEFIKASIKQFLTYNSYSQVCCPNKEIVPPKDDDFISFHSSLTSLLPKLEECGSNSIKTSEYIIGGKVPPLGSFPWLARLGFKGIVRIL